MANTGETNKLSTATKIAIALTVVGALNWGLVGLFRFDLVAAIFGTMSTVTRIIYVVVALAGVYLATVATRLGEGRKEPHRAPARRVPT